MNDKELQGITLRWGCDLDKEDYLVYPKNEVVVNKDEVILDVYRTIVSFFKQEYIKASDSGDYCHIQGILKVLQELERAYPCAANCAVKWKENIEEAKKTCS